MNLKFGLHLTLCTLALCSASLFAQGPRRGGPPPDQRGFPPPQREGRGPDRDGRRPAPPGNQSFSFVSTEMRKGGKTVKSAPFSATAETEFSQTLSNGSKITRKSTALIYRDSEGRTRRDQTLNHVGPFATSEDAPQMVFISDPVAGTSYMLDAGKRTMRKMSFRGGPPSSDRPQPRTPSDADTKTESLGKQVMEGVEAEGTKTTITIPAGKIGNDQPLEIVTERWYSSALQEVIFSKHSDPLYGVSTYRLKNINRSEPPTSLFQPPSDYTQMEDRGPRHKKQDEDE
jgi:hypothetical protein